MKPPPDEDAYEFLHRVLDDLLEKYPGALLLVRREDGTAVVLAAGSSRSGRPADNDREFSEVIRAAPELIRQWANEAIATRVGGAPSPEELN